LLDPITVSQEEHRITMTQAHPDAPSAPREAPVSFRSGANFEAIAGMVCGVALLVAAIVATAAEPLHFVNFPGAILVVGGTVSATLITYSFSDLRRAIGRFGGLLRREHVVDRHDAERFVRVAALWKGGKLHEVEKEAEAVQSPFVKTGMRMLVDGMPLDAIITVLEWRMKHQEALESKQAAVFRRMATYAPAFGMAGTLIGLVNMLRLMGQGATPAQIGTNLAFALVSTLYGLVLANAFLKPIAAKIETKTYDHLQVMSVITEAFRAIGAGHGPSHIREVLTAICEQNEDEMNGADSLVMEERHRAPAPHGR
jgi:chemotaxis protein MotA